MRIVKWQVRGIEHIYKFFLADVSDWLVVETLSMKVSIHAP